MDDLRIKLDAPIDLEHTKSREQAGQTFTYLESWAAIYDFNQVFGHENWNSQVLSVSQTSDEFCINSKTGTEGSRVSYLAHVRVTVTFPNGAISIKDDYGYGDGTSYEHKGKAVESAIKEAVSDAEKRAMRKFGGRFGLHLYDKSKKNIIDYAAQAKVLYNLVYKENQTRPDDKKLNMTEIEKVMRSKPSGREAFEYIKALKEAKND